MDLKFDPRAMTKAYVAFKECLANTDQVAIRPISPSYAEFDVLFASGRRKTFTVRGGADAAVTLAACREAGQRAAREWNSIQSTH